MSTFIPAANLHACYLDDKAPSGLMRFNDGEGEWLFWVIRDDHGAVAVQLTEQNSRRWQAKQLTDDGYWLGLHLGPIEVEVDTAIVELHEGSRGEVGRVFIRGGALYLRAYGQHHHDRVSLKIGEAAGKNDSTSAAAFPNWRLVRHRSKEETVVLHTVKA